MRVFYLTVALILPSVTLLAQGMPVVPYAANFAQTLQSQAAWQPGINAAIRRLNQKNSLTKPQKTVPPIPAASFTYRTDFARRRVNVANFIAELRKTDPVNAAAFEQQFSSTDLFGAVGLVMADAGLKLNNIADVYTVYWISAWELSRGIIEKEPDPRTVQAVKIQAAQAMASTPSFFKASEKDKQEFAEALLFQTLLFSAAVESDKNNLARIKSIGVAVAQGANSLGLDLSTMDLTPTGFVPAKGRKGSDASGAIGDRAKGDTVLASSKAAAPANGDAPANPLATYALIAAAGGAGLGGVYLLGKAVAKKG